MILNKNYESFLKVCLMTDTYECDWQYNSHFKICKKKIIKL